MNSCYISNTEEVYELVVLILNEQFSKEISDLGRDLCYNGISTIPEIMQRMKLSFESVRQKKLLKKKIRQLLMKLLLIMYLIFYYFLKY